MKPQVIGRPTVEDARDALAAINAALDALDNLEAELYLRNEVDIGMTLGHMLAKFGWGTTEGWQDTPVHYPGQVLGVSNALADIEIEAARMTFYRAYGRAGVGGK